jgi:hypothetical protein
LAFDVVPQRKEGVLVEGLQLIDQVDSPNHVCFELLELDVASDLL